MDLRGNSKTYSVHYRSEARIPTIAHSLRSLYRCGITLRREMGSGACLAGIAVQILLYADDIVLISDSPVELQRHLNALKLFCTDKGLLIKLKR